MSMVQSKKLNLPAHLAYLSCELLSEDCPLNNFSLLSLEQGIMFAPYIAALAFQSERLLSKLASLP